MHQIINEHHISKQVGVAVTNATDSSIAHVKEKIKKKVGTGERR